METSSRLLLRPAEVAELLGISRSKLYELLALGELPTVRLGHVVRVPADALETWIRSRIILQASDEEPRSPNSEEGRSESGKADDGPIRRSLE